MKKILTLLLAILLLGNLPLAASADAYIPPEPIEGFDMNYAYMENGTCKALNTFLSNFVEMGLEEFSPKSTDDDLIPAVLKHLELNARFYPKYVKKLTVDGDPYMQITGSHFEERFEHLFGRTVSASECPGYEDGRITVSADHYDGPIQVFASVYDCYPAGDDLWEVYFEPFRIDKDFTGWYTTAYSNLPWDKITSLGSGYALVHYAGGKTDKTISTSDFTLIEFSMEAEDIPCMGANLPHGYTEPTEAPSFPEEGILDGGFDIAVDADTERAPERPELPASTEEPESPTSTQPEAARDTPSYAPEKDVAPPEKNDSVNLTVVLIIILVVAVVLLALLLIVILLVKKKQSR